MIMWYNGVKDCENLKYIGKHLLANKENVIGVVNWVHVENQQVNRDTYSLSN